MKVIIDGNAGTGKTTLAESLRKFGYDAIDVGVPTLEAACSLATDEEDGERCHLILDTTVETSLARLRHAKRPVLRPHIAFAHLKEIREKYYRAADALPRCAIIDASGTPADTLSAALKALEELDIVPTRHVC